MTLKQLEAFYWAATCANFAIAAQRVHLSVSSLSKRISELEASLGCALFDRMGRKAALTPEGERLLPRAHALLQDANELRRSAGAGPGLSGKCRFGSGELSACTWVPRLVSRAAAQHPGLAMEPYVDIGWALEQRVEQGELDFAIVAGTSSRSAIRSEPIGEARFAWVVSPRLLPRRKPGPAEILRDFLIIALPEGAGALRLLDQWLEDRYLPAQRRVTCNSMGAIVGLIVEGMGIGYLPVSWAKSLAARRAVRILDHLPPLPALAYSIQWRRDDDRRLVREMRRLVHDSVDFAAPYGML